MSLNVTQETWNKRRWTNLKNKQPATHPIVISLFPNFSHVVIFQLFNFLKYFLIFFFEPGSQERELQKFLTQTDIMWFTENHARFLKKYAETSELESLSYKPNFEIMSMDSTAKPGKAKEIQMQNLILSNSKKNSSQSKLRAKSYACFKE